jgi:hypothetical protein
MSQVRIDIRELGAAGAPGAFGAGLGERAALASRATASAVPNAAPETRTTRSWWARGLRVVRNAAIAVAVLTLVPVGLVVLRGDDLGRKLFHRNTFMEERTRATDAVRSFRVPRDASITPMQAGLALNALQPRSASNVPGFERIELATRPVPVWQTTELPPGMFPTARPDFYKGPSSRTVLEASVKGFSQAEMEYLRALATAPLWREFDLVARAPAVDVIGGQFRLPFGPDASPEQRPILSIGMSRELAYAAVSRAAYHMALGETVAAETVLRSIMSYGFAFIDNGTSGIEDMLGVMFVNIGRDALRRFYVIQHDPRSELPALPPPARGGVYMARGDVPSSAAEARRQLIARIEDPAVPSGLRFDGLQSLSATSCTNVRELLLGPNSDVRDVRSRARHTLARHPSEQALVDLKNRPLMSAPDVSSPNPLQSLAVSAATVAGTVLQNPRLVSCTRLLGERW